MKPHKRSVRKTKPAGEKATPTSSSARATPQSRKTVKRKGGTKNSSVPLSSFNRASYDDFIKKCKRGLSNNIERFPKIPRENQWQFDLDNFIRDAIVNTIANMQKSPEGVTTDAINRWSVVKDAFNLWQKQYDDSKNYHLKSIEDTIAKIQDDKDKDADAALGILGYSHESGRNNPEDTIQEDFNKAFFLTLFEPILNEIIESYESDTRKTIKTWGKKLVLYSFCWHLTLEGKTQKAISEKLKELRLPSAVKTVSTYQHTEIDTLITPKIRKLLIENKANDPFFLEYFNACGTEVLMFGKPLLTEWIKIKLDNCAGENTDFGLTKISQEGIDFYCDRANSLTPELKLEFSAFICKRGESLKVDYDYVGISDLFVMQCLLTQSTEQLRPRKRCVEIGYNFQNKTLRVGGRSEIVSLEYCSDVKKEQLLNLIHDLRKLGLGSHFQQRDQEWLLFDALIRIGMPMVEALFKQENYDPQHVTLVLLKEKGSDEEDNHINTLELLTPLRLRLREAGYHVLCASRITSEVPAPSAP